MSSAEGDVVFVQGEIVLLAVAKLIMRLARATSNLLPVETSAVVVMNGGVLPVICGRIPLPLQQLRLLNLILFLYIRLTGRSISSNSWFRSVY